MRVVRQVLAKHTGKSRGPVLIALRKMIDRGPFAAIGPRAEQLMGIVTGTLLLSALTTAVTALVLSQLERARIVALLDKTEAQMASRQQVDALARDRMPIAALFARPPASDTLAKLGARMPSGDSFVAIEQDASGTIAIEIVASDPDPVADALRADPDLKSFVQSQLWSDDWGRLHLTFRRSAP
jgi:hypothetical protein